MMSSASNDASALTFDSTPRSRNLELALEAVDRGALSVGITSPNCVVIAADKSPPSRLYDVTTIRPVEMIAKHIGMVYSGIDPDYRVLVQAAREFAQLYYLSHLMLIPVEEVVNRVAKIMKDHANSPEIRPFGVSLLICGWSDSGPHLYQVDPTGIFSSWKAALLGKKAAEGKKFLQERHSQVLSTEDAINTAFHMLREGGCQMIPDNIQIGLCDADGFRRLDQESLQKYLYSCGF